MDSIALAKDIRKHSVGMVYRAGASHIGGALPALAVEGCTNLAGRRRRRPLQRSAI